MPGGLDRIGKMIKGLLKKESPRGVWQISDKGKGYLRQNGHAAIMPEYTNCRTASSGIRIMRMAICTLTDRPRRRGTSWTRCGLRMTTSPP